VTAGRPVVGVQVLVLAKEPVAGRVKTRLCPPLTPAQAADVAAAALADTLDAVRAAPVARRVLVVDGTVPAPGFDVLHQRGGPLDERLGAAFDDVDAAGLPALLIGMDTPQLDAALLTDAAEALLAHGTVLGLAVDGGWWALGLSRCDGDLLRGVPTSRDDTGRLQRERLEAAGLAPHLLRELVDVDTVADAVEVARLAPAGRFGRTVAQVTAPGRRIAARAG
jgi:glycosyltransferase A (GT-A) superfamily protein (DUF2064 family)